MPKKFEQRIIFTITENSQGKMMVSPTLFPRYPATEEEFNNSPLKTREMQAMAARITRHVMAALLAEEKS